MMKKISILITAVSLISMMCVPVMEALATETEGSTEQQTIETTDEQTETTTTTEEQTLTSQSSEAPTAEQTATSEEPMNTETMGIQAAAATVAGDEVIIDLTQPLDSSGQSGYYVQGSNELRLFDPSKHYIIKNTMGNEFYVFVGSGKNYNDAPGNYQVTLDNATINPWQWNMSPFNVGTGSSVDLELVGNNTITAANNWVNTTALMKVPTGASLTIGGSGSLNIFSKVSGFVGAGIGSDNSGAFGNITINSGTINLDFSSVKGIALGGSSSGNLIIGSGATVNAVGAANKPAIGVGAAGTVQIDQGAQIRAYAKGAYAINAATSLGSAAMINAYYANNETADTFAALNAGGETAILCETGDVTLPQGYSSFAYSTSSGEYEHQYSDGVNQYSLVQLTNAPKIVAGQDLAAVPLKKAVVYEVHYYKGSVSPTNLLGITNENGTTVLNETRALLRTIPQPINTVLNSDIVSTDTLDADWLNIAKPEAGYENGVIENQNFGSTSLETNGYIINVVYNAIPYNVTYEAKDKTGGEIPVDSDSYIVDQTVTVKSEVPTRTGYQFLGWKANDMDNIYQSGEEFVMPAEAVKLSAQWAPIIYTVTFDANGGAGTMTNEEYNYGESKSLFKNSYSREGYTFVGWSTTPTGTVEYQDGTDYDFSQEADTTLYAQWEKNAEPVTPVEPSKKETVKPILTNNQKTGNNSSTTVNNQATNNSSKTSSLPKTGETSNSFALIGLVLSGLGMLVVLLRNKRKHQN